MLINTEVDAKAVEIPSIYLHIEDLKVRPFKNSN